MHILLQALTFLCELGGLLSVIYTGLAGMLVGRFFARRASFPAHYPGVTLAKPLHGNEWELESHLASHFEQDYPGPIQFLFGVHDANDDALAAVNAVRTRYPHADITVVADGRLYGANRKIANLVNMLEHARHEVLCFSDSDVRVGRSYLSQVIGTLQKPGIDLVTTPYRALSPAGLWPLLSGAATNYHFLPGVITGLAIGRARPCFGQSMAMTRETLTRIGGLVQFSNHLAEDHAIGEAVRRTGGSVAVPPIVTEHACVENSFSKVFRHELRWSRTIRAADRSGHLGAVLMHPLALTLLATIFSGGETSAWLLTFAALLARILLIWKVDNALEGKPSGILRLPLLVLWEIVQFSIYAASFGPSSVVWRGVRFRVSRDGKLSALRGEE
ncbi:bacteriohopanetetrol glucosamine biosynthesis glycosyltransferase HpnI [Paraburkholderia acidipaludis]|uniref:bacteriohopanetetrol glucosamine biosynthesis glycosyltransferase HpnI n=1 Tax=Paraburkholderia acidipaludis TaxID=660537 RepID=UPI000A022BBB|nr:bacteriohopanetetrol glucosamine biosynthesis glycosyltransferase HpnI [Paraburkholderia acidipaludis]